MLSKTLKWCGFLSFRYRQGSTTLSGVYIDFVSKV